MKKILLSTSFLFAMAITGNAQLLNVDGIDVIIDGYSQNISPDGNVIIGQNPNGDLFSYTVDINKIYDYSDCSSGSGNCISESGLIVGQQFDDAYQDFCAAIMKDGKSNFVPSLKKYGWGILHGITPDGSRICGVVTNPNKIGDIMDPSFNSFMFIPFYCDIDAEGNISEPIWLPVAPKDFFGATPQECSAVWISEDGKTIAGQVVSNNGLYRYPIVYNEGADGEWSYSLPSEKLFNPNGEQIPEFPIFDKEPPSPTDFMSSQEDIDAFNSAYEYWLTHEFDPESDPYANLDNWMTEEQLEAYLNAEEEYYEAANYYNDVILTQYYEKLGKIIESSIFFLQNAFSLSPNGKLLAASHNIAINYQGFMPVENYQPYIFNLEDDTFQVCGSQDNRWLANQIFDDGTLVCATPVPSMYSPDLTPVHSSIYYPEQDAFFSIEEIINNQNPTYGAWMKEYLDKHIPVAVDDDGSYRYVDLIVSGKVSFTADMSTMVGGVDGYSTMDGIFASPLDLFFSYIFKGLDFSAGVKKVNIAENDVYRVYNLQGVKVLETSDKSMLGNLKKGIYVINGQKIVF